MAVEAIGPRTPTGLLALPTELLITILQKTRPPEPPLNHFQSDGEKQLEIRHYRKGLLACWYLRLVCREFDQAMSAILHEDLHIVLTCCIPTKSLWDLFERVAPIAISITIYGYHTWHGRAAKEADLLIDQVTRRGLARCTKLRSLKCRGIEHHTFQSSEWLQHFAPNLSCTITAFSFAHKEGRGGHQLSNSLVSLCGSLEFLEISGGYMADSTAFHLPPAFPKLSRLVLRESNLSNRQLLALFTRIITFSGSDQVPLRSLTMNHSDIHLTLPYDLLDIYVLFSSNRLGTFLTTFRMEAEVAAQDPLTPIVILQLCPNLIEFAYHSPSASPHIFTYLPRSLRTLELAVLQKGRRHTVGGLTQVDIAQFLRSVCFLGVVPVLRQCRVYGLELDSVVFPSFVGKKTGMRSRVTIHQLSGSALICFGN